MYENVGVGGGGVEISVTATYQRMQSVTNPWVTTTTHPLKAPSSSPHVENSR